MTTFKPLPYDANRYRLTLTISYSKGTVYHSIKPIMLSHTHRRRASTTRGSNCYP
jgi:hypothetical protein